ncbi:hypothetical protein LWI28_026093 [Acer negundo]|uniref:DUF659 domain-containing protein n=1 Tax=Acer negundo TaxID=4023 RepID=A0AAD5NVM8_ACENE|nr:hypothetical protein LWI28_026093 [Acer negundo]
MDFRHLRTPLPRLTNLDPVVKSSTLPAAALMSRLVVVVVQSHRACKLHPTVVHEGAVWTYPVSYVAFHTYSIQGLLENENSFFAVGQVRTISGFQALRSAYDISLESNSKWENLLVLFLMAVGYRLVLLVLLFIHELLLVKMSTVPNSFETTNRAETENDNVSNDHAPLWKYVTKLEKMGKAGGNMSFRCNLCEKTYKGSYFRVKNHLLRIKGGGVASCPKVTVAILLEIQKVVEEAELRVKQSLPRQVPLPTTIGSSSGSATNYFQLDLPSSETKKRKGNSGSIEKAFNIGAREQLDGEIARMFYMGGLSFHFARNPHYVRSFKMACSNSIPGEYKDKFFISNLLIETIREIGPQNVVQVITDNAPICKAVGLLVESQFKHIFWTPCVVHTLNLALKSICSPSAHPRYDDIMEECGWIAKISSDVSFIKIFIVNHNMRLAMFNDHSKLKLLSVVDTRFASRIVMLKRFK